jgi:hypothetical protein
MFLHRDTKGKSIARAGKVVVRGIVLLLHKSFAAFGGAGEKPAYLSHFVYHSAAFVRHFLHKERMGQAGELRMTCS